LDKKKPSLSNPAIPEGINASQEHPLKEFFWLLTGVVVVATLVIGVLSLSAGWLAQKIPFEYETQLAVRFADIASSNATEHSSTGAAIEDKLQSLADRLAVEQNLPDGMHITVHYSDSEFVNALATLGGNVVVFRGLIDALPSEDALAMVIAHEIAHIKHRHPIRALGRGATIGVALASIFGVSGSSAGDKLLGEIGLLTALSFSRSQERAADQTALATLVKVYGHSNGAVELFDTFSKLEQEQASAPEVLRTHPHSIDRIEELKLQAEKKGWRFTGQSLPMPAVLRERD